MVVNTSVVMVTAQSDLNGQSNTQLLSLNLLSNTIYKNSVHNSSNAQNYYQRIEINFILPNFSKYLKLVK